MFVDYVIGAEATDWDEYSNEDVLERAVETSRSRHVKLVCSMLTQLCVLLGLLFIARSAVSLLNRLHIDRKLHSSHAKRVEREKARQGAMLHGDTASADARRQLLLVDAARLAGPDRPGAVAGEGGAARGKQGSAGGGIPTQSEALVTVLSGGTGQEDRASRAGVPNVGRPPAALSLR